MATLTETVGNSVFMGPNQRCIVSRARGFLRLLLPFYSILLFFSFLAFFSICFSSWLAPRSMVGGIDDRTAVVYDHVVPSSIRWIIPRW